MSRRIHVTIEVSYELDNTESEDLAAGGLRDWMLEQEGVLGSQVISIEDAEH